MPLELRRVTDETFDDWARAVERGFLSEVADEDLPGWRAVLQPRERFLGIQDDGGWIATAGALPYRMAVPGGDRVGCAGITVVTVRSDHRRRGLLNRMMTTMLQDAVDAGEPFAALLASEGGIYGRYGFGPSAPSVDFEVNRRHAAPVGFGRADRVQLVDAERARAELPAIYDATTDQHPGTMTQHDGWWDGFVLEDTSADRAGGYSKRWHALVPGKGFAIYRTKNDWSHRVPDGKLKVSLLMAADRDTYADLVAFLASVDLVETLSFRNRPVDDPLPLLVADEGQVRDRSSMPLWLRLVDLPAALTSRRYDVADQLVLDVVDRTLPDNQGTWLLEVGPDGSSCTPTDRDGDLRMDVSALGSVFLGGYRASTLHAAGRIDELTPGAVVRLGRAMRTDVAPWLPVHF